MSRWGEKQTAADYIRSRIAVEDRGYKTPCWIWQFWLTEKGYGRAAVPGYGGKTRVHRASYELENGPIPSGLVIDHLCCVQSCCNPDHLEAVTPEENTRRYHQNQPGKCVRGHVLAETRNSSGNCRSCAYIRNLEFLARRAREDA